MRAVLDNPLIRENWHFGLVFVIAIGATAVGFLHGGEAEEKPPEIRQDLQQRDRELPREARTRRPPPERLTEKEKAVKIIEGHQAKFEEDPEGKDAPAYLLAMGTLCCQKLRDYERAAEYYQLLLLDYPDWEMVRPVYIQLATCYERAERPGDAERIFREMLKVFPEDTNEYEYANYRLGL